MSILFSRQCEYALQAVLYLALKPKGTNTSIKELTGRLDLPYHFVAKILQALRKKGLLASAKGPSGGFALGLPANEISLLRIVEAIDGVGLMQACVLGFPECTSDLPCSMHTTWAETRERIYNSLATKYVGEMATEMRKPNYVAVNQ
jgi:Rrf2 family iron-sulfur cluster assembly transcriptional regulator